MPINTGNSAIGAASGTGAKKQYTFTLILIFFTIILFAYDAELKRKEEEE